MSWVDFFVLSLLLAFNNVVLCQPDSVEADPGGNNIVIARFTPAPNSTLAAVYEFKKGGVSSLNRMQDGRLILALQNFDPSNTSTEYDQIAVSFSSDEGNTWTPLKSVTVSGFDKNRQRPFDPTVVPLKDGRVRLYFTSTVKGKNGKQSPRRIHSAISSDGVNYTYEPGIRFAVANMAVGDAAVAQDASEMFHLTSPINTQMNNRMSTPKIGGMARTNGKQAPSPGVPGGGGANMPPCGPNEIPTPSKPCARPIGDPGNGPGTGSGNGTSTQGSSIGAYHAVSKDGLNFTRLDDILELTGSGSDSQWFGNLAYDNGKLLFFGTKQGPWPQASIDGSTWQAAVFSVKIPGVDPAAVKLKDGSWLMSYMFRPPPSSSN